jgi:hypothetical protein
MGRRSRKTPMTVSSRNVTLRDFVIFQLKLALDGLKDLVVFQVSIVAIVLDFIAGQGRRPRLFYSVVRASERFDKWLNLHGVMERLDEGESDDGFFGASEAGADSLLGQIEQLVRRGDEPRGSRKRRWSEEGQGSEDISLEDLEASQPLDLDDRGGLEGWEDLGGGTSRASGASPRDPRDPKDRG